jgi:hypothetical protein
MILYGYLALGFGYYIKRGLNVFYNRKQEILPKIGIQEYLSVDIDFLFEEYGIIQMEY